MAQVTKVEIENQQMPLARADVNNTFQAVASNFAGDAPPSTDIANLLGWQFWADTLNGAMKIWNPVEQQWVTLFSLAQFGGFADTGDLKMTILDVAPDGWVLCDGVKRLKTAAGFEQLAIALENKFSLPGDEPESFRTPNFTGRSPIGFSAQTPIGSIVGAETMALEATHNGPHAHGINQSPHAHGTGDPGHLHGANQDPHNHGAQRARMQPLDGFNPGLFTDSNMVYDVIATDFRQPIVRTFAAATGLVIQASNANLGIQASGAGTPFNLYHPSVAVNYLIKL